MSAGTATTTWLPDARSTTMFLRQQEGVAGTISGTLDMQRQPDGSYVVWVMAAGQATRFEIPAGESFADAWPRIEATMAQASYPSDDMPTGSTSESSVVHAPDAVHAQ